MFEILSDGSPVLDDGWEPSPADTADAWSSFEPTDFDVLDPAEWDCPPDGADKDTGNDRYAVPPGPAAALLFDRLDPASLSSYDQLDAAKSLERLASWAQAKQARMLAAFAYRRPTSGPYDDGFGTNTTISRFAADEVSCALSLTRRGAEDRLGLALHLSDSLPDTLTAWERGDLHWQHVSMIVTQTSVLSPEKAHDVETRILPRADGKTVGQLRRLVERAVINADPDAANRRHDRARLERAVTTRPVQDGMATLDAYLCTEEAALAHDVLTRIARSATTDDPRSMGQRRADALMGLLTGRLHLQPDSDDATTVPADVTLSTPITNLGSAGKPLIHVVVGIGTLMGRDETPAEIPGDGYIPAELARRLAADGIWQRILTEPTTGAVLDVGRARYRPPAALADYIRARDRVCTFPTCRQPASDCDLDHNTPYNKNGETTKGNLTTKCRKHHLLKHHTRWTTRQNSDGTTTWTSPNGHRYTNYPEIYFEEDNPPVPDPAPQPTPTPGDPPF